MPHASIFCVCVYTNVHACGIHLINGLGGNMLSSVLEFFPIFEYEKVFKNCQTIFSQKEACYAVEYKTRFYGAESDMKEYFDFEKNTKSTEMGTFFSSLC